MSNLQEEAKKILPFVQAVAEGKAVQVRLNGHWIDKRGQIWNTEADYRIKPEPKLRPYTREEWEKVDKVKNKSQGSTHTVLIVYDTLVHISGFVTYRFDQAMEVFTNLDGSPCGVLEE